AFSNRLVVLCRPLVIDFRKGDPPQGFGGAAGVVLLKQSHGLAGRAAGADEAAVHAGSPWLGPAALQLVDAARALRPPPMLLRRGHKRADALATLGAEVRAVRQSSPATRA